MQHLFSFFTLKFILIRPKNKLVLNENFGIKARVKHLILHIQKQIKTIITKKQQNNNKKHKMFVSSAYGLGYGYGLAAPAWGYSSWGYAPACGYRSAYGLW